ARRRNAHLRRDARVALQIAEVVEHRMAREADLAGDPDALRLGLDPGELDAVVGRERGDAVEAAEEIEMPPRAAELAVGRALQADVLLLLDDGRDLAVLCRAQRLGRDLAALMLGARLLERGGPQQAADVIGAKLRLGAWQGGAPPFFAAPRRAVEPYA